jgi:hypothetical protein
MKDGYFLYWKNSNLGDRMMFRAEYDDENKEAIDTFINYLRNIDCIE